MAFDAQTYWRGQHDYYHGQPWMDLPTIFATQAISYFPPTGRLLDLGAGQGQDSRYFAAHGYDVISTDISPRALEISQQKAAEQKLVITIQEVDIGQPLLFSDGEFDIVYSHLGLHYFDKQTTQKVFAEIHRVLKPGGVLATFFNAIDDPEMAQSQDRKVEDHYFVTTEGLGKAFFSIDYARELLKGLFEPILLDGEGAAHKDELKYVRFIGRAR